MDILKGVAALGGIVAFSMAMAYFSVLAWAYAALAAAVWYGGLAAWLLGWSRKPVTEREPTAYMAGVGAFFALSVIAPLVSILRG